MRLRPYGEGQRGLAGAVWGSQVEKRVKLINFTQNGRGLLLP
jgi:hypothetical protein